LLEEIKKTLAELKRKKGAEIGSDSRDQIDATV
jgi:hypothetical protein